MNNTHLQEYAKRARAYFDRFETPWYEIQHHEELRHRFVAWAVKTRTIEYTLFPEAHLYHGVGEQIDKHLVKYLNKKSSKGGWKK